MCTRSYHPFLTHGATPHIFLPRFTRAAGVYQEVEGIDGRDLLSLAVQDFLDVGVKKLKAIALCRLLHPELRMESQQQRYSFKPGSNPGVRPESEYEYTRGASITLRGVYIYLCILFISLPFSNNFGKDPNIPHSCFSFHNARPFVALRPDTNILHHVELYIYILISISTIAIIYMMRILL